MALIKCEECKKEISTEATACPHCGFPISKDTSKPQPLKSQQKNVITDERDKDDDPIILHSSTKYLSKMVKAQLIKLSDNNKYYFMEEFGKKRRKIGIAYLASLFFFHYAYVGKWPFTILGWLVGIGTLTAGIIIWWVIDLFRMSEIVTQSNDDIALEIIKNLKSLDNN